MRRNFFLGLLLFLTPLAVLSQAAPRDSIFKIIAQDICKEIIANDSLFKKPGDLETELGFLMLPIYSKYEEQLRSIFPGFAMTNSETIEQVSRKVGEKLAFVCPTFVKLISGNKEILNITSRAPEEKSLKGTLLKIMPGEFASIQLKTTNGKIEKIWWMEYFDGANDLLGGRKLLNKEVTLIYTEREVFNGTLNEYVTIKIARGIR